MRHYSKRMAGIGMFCLAVAGSVSHADTIKVGSLQDLTGSFNIYGIQQSRALNLAVNTINGQGGVNGKRLEVIEYDAQSDDARYTQYANTLILRDQVSVIFGGTVSSSRETIRPIARQNRVLYFYSPLYEGGVCDRYTFATGVTPSQQLRVMLDWARKEYGNRIYVVAPNYNFGTISAHWVKEYAAELGMEVVGEDFLPVSQSDFSSTLQQIQTRQPDMVVALPVGSRQTSFYEQFAAAGLKGRIGVVSTNYGSGNQQVVVSSEAGNGIVASQNYFQVIENDENAAFVKAWEKAYGATDEPIISAANDTWNAVMVWAAAANKAGSIDTEAVIDTLHEGVSIKGPEGEVKSLPSNHLMHQVYLVRGDGQHSFEIIDHYSDIVPVYEQAMCNLVENPDLSTQFSPE